MVLHPSMGTGAASRRLGGHDEGQWDPLPHLAAPQRLVTLSCPPPSCAPPPFAGGLGHAGGLGWPEAAQAGCWRLGAEAGRRAQCRARGGPTSARSSGRAGPCIHVDGETRGRDGWAQGRMLARDHGQACRAAERAQQGGHAGGERAQQAGGMQGGPGRGRERRRRTHRRRRGRRGGGDHCGSTRWEGNGDIEDFSFFNWAGRFAQSTSAW
jgi:hypothetical protein